jgi:dihydroxyacetone kinase-like protein
MLWVYQIAGAKAESLASLEEVVEIAHRANENTRTIGVGLSSCIVPANGKATFALADDEIEVGLGIHGEPGMKRQKVAPVDQIIDEMFAQLIADLDYRDQRVALSINGLGGTPAEELFVVYRKVKALCDAHGITIAHKAVGEFVTALEMAGASISLTRLDPEMESLLNAPVNTCMFKKLQRESSST